MILPARVVARGGGDKMDPWLLEEHAYAISRYAECAYGYVIATMFFLAVFYYVRRWAGRLLSFIAQPARLFAASIATLIFLQAASMLLVIRGHWRTWQEIVIYSQYSLAWLLGPLLTAFIVWTWFDYWRYRESARPGKTL